MIYSSYIYIYIYIQYTYVYIYIYTHTYIQMCLFEALQNFNMLKQSLTDEIEFATKDAPFCSYTKHLSLYISLSLYDIYVFIGIYVYVCMYTCVYTYIYIYIYICSIERETCYQGHDQGQVGHAGQQGEEELLYHIIV